jgi:NADPH:quinone reductase-like Zn-dependent oxidoreductase
VASARCGRSLRARARRSSSPPDRAERRAFLEAQGLTRVYSSRTTDFVDAIRSATAGTGVDVVVNSLPGPLLTASLGLLAPYGRFVEIGRTDIARDAQLGLSPFARNLSFSALDLDRLARDRPGVVREVFAEVLAAFGAGELTPLPRRVFGVADVDQALEYMTARRHVGKIVIDYAPTAESGAGSPVPCVRHDATYSSPAASAASAWRSPNGSSDTARGTCC